MRGGARAHAAALGAYGAVAIVHTFPLVTRLTTAFPESKGTKDVFGFIWNNWWLYHAVTKLHVKPYLTDYIFQPHQIDLRLDTFGLLYGLLSMPAVPLFGPVAVLNAQLLLTMVLNGYCAFRLARHLTNDAAVAFISGLLVASTPAIDFHLDVGRPSCAALWPAICVLYFALRLLQETSLRLALGLAVSVTAALMADQQIALFCVLWVGILALYALKECREALSNARFWRGAILVVALSLPAAYGLYYRPLTHNAGYALPGNLEARSYSMTLRYLMDPVVAWRVYGLVLPGGLLVALLGLRRSPQSWPWSMGALAFLILTLGPVLHGTEVSLPFAALQRLPGLEQFRTPYRFEIPAALGMAMATGAALALVARAFPAKRRILLGAIGLIAMADVVGHRVAFGFPLQTMPHESIYAAIAEDRRDCLVLEVPLGVRTGTDRIGSGEELTFYQPIHEKRLVNGFTARAPRIALDYYRQSPALMLLAGERPPPGNVEEDLERRMGELRVGYVLVHKELLAPEVLPKVVALFQARRDLSPLEDSDTLIAYRRSAP